VKIRVDNLGSDVTKDELHTLFECFGRVAAVHMQQGRAQIEMPSKSAAKDAIEGLNGQNLKGYDMSVAEMVERSHQGNKPRRRPRRR
jgi:RNA recognition motif-containing protein